MKGYTKKKQMNNRCNNKMNISDIKKIYIQKSVLDNQRIQKILPQFKNTEIQVINEIKEVPTHYIDKKKSIIFGEQNGSFIKKCPCTPNYLGCEYWVVELSVGCLYDCTYCYLQEYQNIFATSFYVNFDKLYQEFDGLLRENPDELYRIGFGEYADSLFLDEVMNYTYEISDYLSKKHENYLIEYKTKSNNISNLLKFKPTGKEVVGWTINTIKICNSEEKYAANFYERLEAMQQCVNHGYFVAVHFDPVISYDGWERDYKFVVDEIFKRIDKNMIIWISIGSLRFNSKLKPIIEYRHPDTKIIYGEMIKGADNKSRYLKSIRIELYKKIVGYLKEKDENVFVYFCMEDNDVWKEVLGLDVRTNEEIHDLFCRRKTMLTKR